MGILISDSISKMWEPIRDFAYAKIPQTKISSPTVCAINETDKLVVVSNDGSFFYFAIDEVKGGECNSVVIYTFSKKK